MLFKFASLFKGYFFRFLAILATALLATVSLNSPAFSDSIDHDISSSSNDVKFFYDYDLSNKVSDEITTKTNHVFVPVDKDTDYEINGLNQYDTVTVDTVESTLTYDANELHRRWHPCPP